MAAQFTPSARFLSSALTLYALVAMPASAAIDPTAAAKVFGEARQICARDAAALWGHTLCGPMLLIDPADNTIITNHADAAGGLKASGSVFTGVMASSEIVANTSIEWAGIRWTEILWPLPQDDAERHVMIAHELFHRIQPELGVVLHEGDNKHLDTLQGRYLLQLEWRALAAALRAPTTAERRAAISDALLFRRQRYQLFPEAAAGEGALEANEGVAEYTGVRLGLDQPKARVDYATKDLSKFVPTPSFVRSFAYATGPAYGLLLDQAEPAWRHKLTSGKRLDQLLGSALQLPPPAFATLNAREKFYDNDGTLHAHEVQRDKTRRVRLAALKARLVDGAVLTLPLKHSNYQFNPQTLQPLGKLGMVYPTLRLTDDWGVLDVTGDALVNQAAGTANVSLAGIDQSRRQGDGWKLSLSKGWTVVPGARKGDLVVRQEGSPVH